MTKTETYISFIIDKLKSGVVDYKDNVSVFCAKFRCSDRTFDKYWKLANERHKDTLNKANKAKDELFIESEKEAFKRNLLTKEEKREILAQIARGEMLVDKIVATKDGFKNVKSKPDLADRMKAIELESKMTGDFAPTKIDSTLKGVDEIVIKRKRDN